MSSYKLVGITRVCCEALSPRSPLTSPIIITNLATKWPATTKWRLGQLERHYGNRLFECGRDSLDNTPILMKLNDYLKSDRNNYLFDSSFDYDASEMNDDYTVPSLFADDFLDYLPNELIDGIDRRWLIIGRDRFQGGSNFHQDPIGNSWNTLLEGRKKWIIIEPNADDCNIGQSLSPTINFCNFGVNKLYYDNAKGIMPKISDKARNVYIFYQYPGDTVYIPYKYHHLVLNLSTSVAITHNYVPRKSERILSFLQDVKPDLSSEKYQKLDDYVRNNMNKLINNGNL